MHGAGNDFILVDDRALRFPADDAAFIQQMATRRLGIGCEGVILLQPSQTADLRMRFFNPDGAEQSMCGNGARCFARLAYDLDAAPEQMKIETRAGEVEATVKEGIVELAMPEATQEKRDLQIEGFGAVDFLDTGVAHAVVWTKELEAFPVTEKGRELRYHPTFAPEGTNADFVKVENDASLSIRTYERGVEAETLACGTGAVAAALLAKRRGWIRFPVEVHCKGGTLQVDLQDGKPCLSGNAEYIFKGEIGYGNRI